MELNHVDEVNEWAVYTQRDEDYDGNWVTFVIDHRYTANGALVPIPVETKSRYTEAIDAHEQWVSKMKNNPPAKLVAISIDYTDSLVRRFFSHHTYFRRDRHYG